MIETRYHSLDAVRAWALLAGIVLHATMSFLPAFQEVRWPIVDVSQSDALSLLFFVIQFPMALSSSRGILRGLLPSAWSGLLKNLLRRVGLP